MSRRNAQKPNPVDLDSINVIQRLDDPRSATSSANVIKPGARVRVLAPFITLLLFFGLIISSLFAVHYVNTRSPTPSDEQIQATIIQSFYVQFTAYYTQIDQTYAASTAIAEAYPTPNGIPLMKLNQPLDVQIPLSDLPPTFDTEPGSMYVFTVHNTTDADYEDSSTVGIKFYSGSGNTQVKYLEDGDRKDFLLFPQSSEQYTAYIDPYYGSVGFTGAKLRALLTLARKIEIGQRDVNELVMTEVSAPTVVYYRVVTNGEPTTLTYRSVSDSSLPTMTLGHIGNDGLFVTDSTSTRADSSLNIEVPSTYVSAPVILRLEFAAGVQTGVTYTLEAR